MAPSKTLSETIRLRPFARADYAATLAEMRAFTRDRDDATADEIWLVEHPPVFTQGLAGKPEHLLATGDTPVVPTERGGQVTYHGPGQVVAYLMLDLHRRGLLVRDLVCRMERAAIRLLATHGVDATRREGAPGVYLRNPDGSAGAKIAALGIKVSRGRTYHGIALNVAMDLQPFSRINPCGYPGLAVTDLRSVVGAADVAQVAAAFGQQLLDSIGNA
ncbi:MAG: hypothetical protein RIS35_828 [Pseudomonadota bacterium]|jgi:lipoyl(octanoyl) transferase